MEITINIKKPLDSLDFLTLVEKNKDKYEIKQIDKEYLRNQIFGEDLSNNISDIYILDNIDKSFKKLSLNGLSKLSLNIFELYPNKFNWEMISYLNLPQSFIEKNLDRLDNNIISSKQLSKEFIEKNHKNLNIEYLYLTNDLPDSVYAKYEKEIEDIKNKNKNVIHNSLNLDLDEIREQIKRNDFK